VCVGHSYGGSVISSVAADFFEFIKSIAAAATDGDTVRLAPVLIQPIAADDVAGAVGKVSVGAPAGGVVEVAGPEQFRLDELIRRGLSARNDPRCVAPDLDARYFGARLGERTLPPGVARASARPASRTG
jgi:uncharacterized protein YbjT (DUF2867 family)